MPPKKTIVITKKPVPAKPTIVVTRKPAPVIKRVPYSTLAASSKKGNA